MKSGNIINKGDEILNTKDKRIEELNNKIDSMKNEFQIFMQKTSLLLEKFVSLDNKNKYNIIDDDFNKRISLENPNEISPAYLIEKNYKNTKNNLLNTEEINLINYDEEKKTEIVDLNENDSEKTLVCNLNHNMIGHENTNLKGCLKDD